MATNTKMLELTFNVEGGRSMILSIPSPKEGSHSSYGEGEGGPHHPGAGVFLRRSRHFAEKCENRGDERYRAGIGTRSDWYTTFGHRPICTRGETVTSIPHSSFEQSFHSWARGSTPLALSLHPFYFL